MRELSLHLLDIAENSITAHASEIQILVEENTRTDRFAISVKDNGKGMSPEMVKQVIDPFVTTRTTRKVGLGIPLLKAAAEACNGNFEIQSTLHQGTQLRAEFQRSHIDRMPLGDLTGTLLSLFVGNPQIHWIFTYIFNDHKYIYDDQEIKKELGDIPLSEPLILSFIRETLETGIQNTIRFFDKLPQE